MAQVINTNVRSLYASQSLVVNGRGLNKTMQQLSTGNRINSAADDAAGLSIGQIMTTQIKGLDQAVRNANDAIGFLQTAEGALGAVSNMAQRMRELAVQSANDTNSADQQGYLDAEYQALAGEIDRILAGTTWNGMSVFAGDAGRDADGIFVFQVGAGSDGDVDGNDAIDIDLSAAVDLETIGGTATVDIGDAASALTEIDTLDAAIDGISALRSTIGSTINRLTYAADNAANISTNTQAARSQIMDVDYASATTDLAKQQIIQQAATAMLAQANQLPQAVLALLK
jgi:flagellin